MSEACYNSRIGLVLDPVHEVEQFHVVANRISADAKDCVWSVSPDQTSTGWDTDSGCDGYGLPFEYAKFLCDAANEKLARERRVK